MNNGREMVPADNLQTQQSGALTTASNTNPAFNERYVTVMRIIQRCYYLAVKAMLQQAKLSDERYFSDDKNENGFKSFITSVLQIKPEEFQTLPTEEAGLVKALFERLPPELRIEQRTVPGFFSYFGTKNIEVAPLENITAEAIIQGGHWSSDVTGDMEADAADAIKEIETFMQISYGPFYMGKVPATNPVFLVSKYLISNLQKMSVAGPAKPHSAFYAMFSQIFIQQMQRQGAASFSLQLGDSGEYFMKLLTMSERQFKDALYTIRDKTWDLGVADFAKEAINALENAIKHSIKALGGIISNEATLMLRDKRKILGLRDTLRAERKDTTLLQEAVIYFVEKLEKPAQSSQYADEVINEWLRAFESEASSSAEGATKVDTAQLVSKLQTATQRPVPTNKIKLDLQDDLKTIISLYKGLVSVNSTGTGVDEAIRSDGVTQDPSGLIWRWLSLFYILTLVQKSLAQIKLFKEKIRYQGEFVVLLLLAKQTDLALGGAIPTIQGMRSAQTKFKTLIEGHLSERQQMGASAYINPDWLRNLNEALDELDRSNNKLNEAQSAIKKIISLTNNIQEQPAMFLMHMAKECIASAASAQYHHEELKLFFTANELVCIPKLGVDLIQRDATSAAALTAVTAATFNQTHAVSTANSLIANPQISNNLQNANVQQLRDAASNGPTGNLLTHSMDNFINNNNNNRLPYMNSEDARHLQQQQSRDQERLQEINRQERLDLIREGGTGVLNTITNGVSNAVGRITNGNPGSSNSSSSSSSSSSSGGSSSSSSSSRMTLNGSKSNDY